MSKVVSDMFDQMVGILESGKDEDDPEFRALSRAILGTFDFDNIRERAWLNVIRERCGGKE